MILGHNKENILKNGSFTRKKIRVEKFIKTEPIFHQIFRLQSQTSRGAGTLQRAFSAS